MRRSQLKTALGRLPEYDPPDELWDRIDADLNRLGTGSQVAHALLEAMRTGDFTAIAFASDFVWRTPMGRMSCQEYTAAGRNLAHSLHSLEVQGVMADNQRACLRYVLHFRDGRADFQAMDWLSMKDGKLVEVNAYFDASRLFNQMSA